MNAERYERLQALFLEARDLPPLRRDGFLERVSRREPDLRAELELLLSHDDSGSAESSRLVDALARGEGALVVAHFLEGLDSARADGLEPALPRQLGRYTLVRRIGRGGMGEVYEAEQDDPRRRVALKVIRQGMESPQSFERFRREAHMLGRLRHPGIAQIYDAHTARSGGEPPYFAMELVAGPPLTEFARINRLDVRRRLELVAEICEALDHAHRAGLVHRDLKPGNILVEPLPTKARGHGTAVFDSVAAQIGGQPKILDFGIARSSDLRTLTAEADVGRLIGTLPYMSPEQASGGAIDARSDIYSIGVIAFELLAGRLPLDLCEKPIAEAARIIRDEDPARLGSIDRRLRGDVETIVAKALEKDPARRYPSAAALAADVRRHLADQPIVARPASRLYRLAKFVRRRRHATAVAATMLAAGVVSLVQFGVTHDARREREKALESADDSAWHGYAGALAAAATAVEAGNPDSAGRFLAEASWGRGTWEHRYVSLRLAAYRPLMETETPIAAASIDSDGESLLTASRAGLIQRWDSRTGELRHGVSLEDEITGPAEFTENGRRLVAVVGPAASCVSLRDCADGSEIARLESEEIAAILGRTDAAPVTAVAISPDGERVAVGGNGGVLWCPGAEKSALLFLGERIVDCLAFGVDGRRLLSGYRAPEKKSVSFLRGFDAGTGAPSHDEVRINSPRVQSIAVPSDGDLAFAGFSNGLAKFVDVATGDRHLPFKGNIRHVTAVAVDPRGHRVATGSLDGVIRVFESRSRVNLRNLVAPGDSVSRLAFSSNGSGLLAVADRFARVFEVEPLDAKAVLGGHESPVAFVGFGAGSLLVSVGMDGAVIGFDSASGECVARLSIGADDVTCADVSPAARLLATGHDGGRVRVWNPETGEAIAEHAIGDAASVTAVAFSPDGSRLAARTARHVFLFLGDVRSGCAVWEAEHSGAGSPGALSFSPDGSRLASDDGKEGVRVWSASDGESLFASDGLPGSIASLEFSPDGGLLAGGTRYGSLLVWDLRSGDSRSVSDAHAGGVGALAFSPDGARLASGSNDGSIVIWETSRWRKVLTLRCPPGGPATLAFSSDGSRLASGSSDRDVRVWTAPLSSSVR